MSAELEPPRTDFHWVSGEEPHVARRKAILAAHPEIKELYGPCWKTCPQVLFVVSMQVALAKWASSQTWPVLVVVAYVVGGFAQHNLFLANHELSHSLAFKTKWMNKVLGIVSNLPILIPYSTNFKKYHLEHHTAQGYEQVDMDIPSSLEAWVVSSRNPVTKSIWVLLQLAFYALRPPVLKPKDTEMWDVINALAVIAFDAALYMLAGPKAFAYLALGAVLGGGFHPVAGHFIAEHYVMGEAKNTNQETFSYYGPLNALVYNVGFHNEHHDFPQIPGSRLSQVRAIAPEFYNNLQYHTSWTYVIWRYVTDPNVGPFSRVKRNDPHGEDLKKVS